jgi:hypothetical protein
MKKLIWLALLLPTFVIADVSDAQHAQLATHCAKDPGTTNKARIQSCWAEEAKGRLETLEENTGNPGESAMSIKAVDANDMVIGELVTLERSGNWGFDAFSSLEYLEVNIPMIPEIGEQSGLFYLTTDCTGAAYSDNQNGTVYLALQPDGVYAKYYAPKSSLAQFVTIQSYTNIFTGSPSPCAASPGDPPQWWFPAIQNVPAITGVENIMYTLPITFQRQ